MPVIPPLARASAPLSWRLDDSFARASAFVSLLAAVWTEALDKAHEARRRYPFME
jgi:hypothetical protein